MSATRSISVAPVDEGVRDRAGGAGLGFLAALVDVDAALVALIAGRPDWTATADLTLHATGRLATGPAVVSSRLVRAGANIVVVGADVYDAHGRDVDEVLALLGDLEIGDERSDVRGGRGGDAEHSAAGDDRSGGRSDGGDAAGTGDGDGAGRLGRLERAAVALLTFARIPRAASASQQFDPASVIGERRSLSPPGPRPGGPLHERIGLRVVDAAAGVVELAKTDYVRNSFGAINGGVLGMVVQGAAEAALPGFVATDLQVHYLAQARVGPARTAVTVLRRSADHALCAVESMDAGDGDQLLSLASVTLQRLV